MADQEGKKDSSPHSPHTIKLGDKIIVLDGPDPSGMDMTLDEFWADQYLAQGYDKLYMQAYHELCELVTGQPPSDDIPDESSFKKQVSEYLQIKHIDLFYAICVEFDYCAKRKAIKGIDASLGAIVNLIGILSGAGLTVGVATVVWALSTDLLSKFCKCDEK